ncbi:VCBS domain-containing protein [Sphingobium sp. LB126]|uniref:beta strand repeat-containing protein n=1 Tax=Sphingobium sp. LB126 TaxID=1983755 RepID=UPI0018D4E8DB|nr:VCBS domain-containing protein [Sphingobium sp. LB126]
MDMDFERNWDSKDAGDHQQALHPEASALAAKGKAIHPGKMHHHAGPVQTVTPNAQGVVVLPAGTDINQIEVEGRNLIVHLPDGTEMVIVDGAVVMPQLVVGDVEIPSVNLAALLIGQEPQPAAGPARSSGGNFIGPDGDVGDPHGLGDLLPPTELQFTQPEQREILPIAPGSEPEVVIVTPNQPAGAIDATAGVSEAGLPARGNEPAGSAAATDSERTSGTIQFAANDGLAGITINGVTITAVGQTVTTPLGVLTITSVADNAIGYSYVLSDNVVGAPPSEIFTVVVTDSDGDHATATLTISIADDAPTAVNDVDSVTEDGPLVADGNVLTGVGGSDANATDGVADIQGADGAVVSTTGSFQGTYGVLTLTASGAYSYTLANDNAAVQFLVPGQTLTDSFSYTITDADGDTSTATLTITINGADDGITITGLNGTPGVEGAEVVVLESHLADGSAPDAAALTHVGSFGVNGADGISTVTIGGVTVLANGAFVAGQVVTTPVGTLTITGFTATASQGGVPTAGTFSYSFVLTDNSLAHDAAGADSIFQSFAVVATDRNGSTANATVDVQIVDDVPVAHNDVDGVAAGSYGPETGNVITGAGTVSGTAGADVVGADGAVVSSTGSFQGSYGTLTLNADGSYSYVRAAGTPGGVSDSFTYTLRDGDGDTSTATLRIDIANSEVTIISIPKVGEGTIVDESGLTNPMGSNAGSGADATGGTITYSAPDGPASITINGTPIGVGTQITTDKGILTITGLNDGQIEYTYQLTTNTAGDDVKDNFTVTVTDVDGDSATDTLTITIIDDVPTAVNDADSVREDGPLVADGNVITGSGGSDANGTDGNADVQGADGAHVTAIVFGETAGTVGTALAGAYGSLLIQSDGSYAYTLNNENGVVQGLDKNQTLTETFTYTLTDGDGDARNATITITIQGSDDGVTIGGLDGEGAEEIVYENDLPGGSSENAAALTQTGSFTLSALDGVATITVGGQPIFGASGFISGVTLSNAYGTLTITGFTPTVGADGDVIGGTVSYSYVLNDNTLLHTGANDGSLTDSFAVVVTDTDGSNATASLDITVVDDVPTAVDDVVLQPSENVAIDINVIANDTKGADGVDLATGVALTTGPSQGTAVYQGNGIFHYTPNAGAEGTDSFTYTITDGDGDHSTATVTITLAGDSKPTVQVSDLTVSEAGLPLGSDPTSNSETASGAMTIATGGDTLAKVEVQDKNGAWVDVTAATVGTPVVVSGAAGQLTVTSDGSGHYSYSYTLAVNDPTHPDNNPLDGDGISGAADPKAGDSFAVRVTDSDGDVSPSASIDVTVLDDAPTLSVDGQTSVVEGATATGSWSEVIGADQPGASTVVIFGGNSYAIGAAIDTGLGTLTVKADHSWTFVSHNNIDNSLNPSISFTVQVTDADGDVAQDSQTVAITDGAGPTAGEPLSLQMDDQNLADGTTPGKDDFAQGAVSFTAGSDALTGFAFATDLSALDGGLTWNRVSATLIEGWDGAVGTGTKVVALTLSAPASIGAGLSGNVTITATLLDNYAHHPVATADDLAQLGHVGVVASDVDGSNATATVNLSVSDDVPSLTLDGAVTVVEGQTATGTWSEVIGADQPGATTQVLFGGNSYAIGAAIDTGLGTLTVKADHSWTFVANGNLNNNLNPSISFDIKVTDADGDVAQKSQTVAITDGADPTAGPPISLGLDDQNLAGGTSQGNPDFTSGTITFTPGSDAITSIVFGGIGSLTGDLNWVRVSDTQITGSDERGVVVTLDLSVAGNVATVTATLNDNYDTHPGINVDDLVALGSVQVIAQDTDGDTAVSSVSVSVSDDLPVVSANPAVQLDDDALSGGNAGGTGDTADSLNVTGTLAHDYRADGPGGITLLNTGAPSGFTYESNGTVLLVKQGGTTVLTVTLTDPVAGTYSVVQNAAISHPAGGNENNVSFSIGYRVTDADHDYADGSLTINVNDDTPVAANDTDFVKEDVTLTASGNVLTGVGSDGNPAGADSLGADGPAAGGAVTAVTGGTIGGNAAGAYGTLVLNASGTYTYTLNNGLAAVQHLGEGQTLTDSFTYTITDGDGDSTTAVLTITIQGTNDAPLVDKGIAIVSEEGLFGANPDTVGSPSDTTNSAVATGTITASDADGNTIGMTLGDPGAVLTADGLPVTWTGVGTQALTGSAGGVPVITITITNGGAYTVTLLQSVDHNGLNVEDLKNFSVPVNVTDGITTVATSIAVTIEDDSPTAADDNITTTENAAASTGNVLTNDHVGADTPGAVVSINGSVITAGGSQTIVGSYGTLQIFSDGSYNYTPKTSVPSGSFDSFTYVMRDADNDTATATLKFTFAGDANKPTADNTAAKLDDDGLTGGNPLSTTGDVDANVGDNGIAGPSEASFSGTLPFTFGADGGGSVTFANLNGTTGTVGTETVAYSWNAGTNTLTATVNAGARSGTALFQVVVNPTTGAYTATLLDNVLHAAGGNENNAAVSLNFLVTDSDYNATTNPTSSAIGQLNISFNDDMPTLGVVQSQQTDNNVATTPAVGTLHYAAGADGTGSMLITADTSSITVGGQAVSTVQNGNVLTAYVDADHSGGFNAGDTTVFTLTVNPDAGTSGQYVFDLVTKLDPVVTDVPIGSGSSFGSGPSNEIVVTDKLTSQQLVYVTGWAPTGGFTPQEIAIWEAGGAVAATQTSNVNGSTQGWGLSNNNFDAGEFLRFDFGTLADYDGAGGYTPPGTYNIVNASYATFSFFNFTSGEKIIFVAHYTNGTTQAFEINGPDADNQQKISAPGGTLIDWIDVYQSSGDMKLNLTNVGVASSSVDKTIPFTLQLTDGDGDTTATQSFSVHVKDGLSPAIPAAPIAVDLDGDGLEFVPLSAGVNHDYGQGVVGTAWVSSDDGLLAHVVGSGYDIVFSDDAAGAKSDLEGLRLAYDSNGDGKFDANDAAFHEFGVWQDANSNGVVDAGEFKSLAAMGIASIDLTADGKGYTAADGDVTVLGEASFTRTDGTKGTVGDVTFLTGASSDASKSTESPTSGFNQALLAASLVAAVGAAEATHDQQPAPAATETAPVVTETAPASTATVEPTATESNATSLAPADGQSTPEAQQPAQQASHGGDEPATDHATLSDGGAAHAPASVDTAEADQPSLGDHQGLLAQSINLPSFDGNAAAVLAAAQQAAQPGVSTANAAEVVKEALGTHDAPHIDALLAALPGGEHPVVPALFNPVAVDAVDSGHLAAATAIFEAAMVAHEAMAVGHA